MSRKPRRRAWGSITTKSKTVHVLRWVEDTPQGRKRKSRTFHGTYRDACLELDRIHVERGNAAPGVTVGRAYKLWWEPWQARRIAEGRVKAQSVKRLTDCWANCTERRWAHVPIDAVKPLDVQEWLLQQNHSNAKVSLEILRKVGDFAVQYEVAGSNRFRVEYELPVNQSRKKRAGVFTLEQARAAWDVVRGTDIEAPFLLACFGGCRTGESLGVRCDEVSLHEVGGVPLAFVPIIRKTDSDAMEPGADNDLKTPQSIRTALVPGEYAERLDELARVGHIWLADRGDGLPMTQSALKYRWGKEPIEPALPFGACRASWRTFAQTEWGIDYDTCELLMGHTLQGVTGKHYFKPTTEQLAPIVAAAYKSSQMG